MFSLLLDVKVKDPAVVIVFIHHSIFFVTFAAAR